MNTTMNQMLEDLYEMDPSLKEHDKELRGILKELMEVRPDVQIDEDFVRALRSQLSEMALAKSEAASEPKGWLVKLLFSLSGAAVMAILFLTVAYLPPSRSALFLNGIKTVGQTAFDLSGSSAPSPEAAPTAPRALNTGGGVSSSRIVNSGAGGVADSKMMAPYPGIEQPTYLYIYDGPLPATTDSQMGVIRRLPVSVNDNDFTSVLKGFDFGLMSIKSFGNLKTDYISVSEDKEYGYTIQVSFTDGIININQNWNKWPNPFINCTDDACYQRLALKPEDVPSDDALISIAESFMKEHGISLENYGAARVNRTENIMYKAAEDVAAQQVPVFVPDYMTVVYPEKVDGKIVTESDGAASGISVSISVRDKKVSAVNNLRAGSSEKSLYDTETDTTKLLDWAKKGGANYYDNGSPEAKVIDVKLGDPEIVYYKFYKWVQDGNRNEEYLIPAYSFPVVKSADYQLYRSNILVPLIKGFEDQNPDQGTGPVPVPFMAR